MQFVVKEVTGEDKNAGLFSPSDGNKTDLLWPTSGVNTGDGRILVFAQRVYETGTGPFDFAFRGTQVIEIRNPNDAPDAWDMDMWMMQGSSGKRTFAAAATVDQEWLYLLGSQGEGISSSQIVAKIRFVAHCPAALLCRFFQLTNFYY
jgi:hypothetical protein